MNIGFLVRQMLNTNFELVYPIPIRNPLEIESVATILLYFRKIYFYGAKNKELCIKDNDQETKIS